MIRRLQADAGTMKLQQACAGVTLAVLAQLPWGKNTPKPEQEKKLLASVIKVRSD